jgi:hypothetical protein
MQIIGTLPPREIDGADQVLDGMVVETTSGNHCRFWPAMVSDDAAQQTRIAFFMEWRCMATPEDIAEVTALTNELMGATPAFTTESVADPCTNPENLEWLRSGKIPPPPKAN